jgi:predicted nucleotidyltransferase
MATPTSTALSRPDHRPLVVGEALGPAQLAAARLLVRRALAEIPARLVQAALFGSRARAEAHPGSDVDILLVFHSLPPDREPHAGQAEAIAASVAAITGIPVTVWSVSLVDLDRGNRTPMLVDALEDALPIWCRTDPLPPVRFTPEDALHCVQALMQRVAEGGIEFSRALARRDFEGAARRARDDLVRLSTGFLLLQGVTRPRRGDAVRAALELGLVRGGTAAAVRLALAWAADSFGADGADEHRPLTPPPLPPAGLADAVEHLRARVTREAERRHRSCTFRELARRSVPRHRGPDPPRGTERSLPTLGSTSQAERANRGPPK